MTTVGAQMLEPNTWVVYLLATRHLFGRAVLYLQNWWQLYPPISSTQGCQLAAAVYHLSSSRDQAWTSISQALWHGLALDLRATDTR